MTKTQLTNASSNKTNQHGKHKSNYYAKNKQKYLLANQKYRAKLKAQKLPKIPSVFQQKNQKKTGTLYFQGKKIGDTKISGEVMLPGNAYYDKNGKFLGYYE